MSVIEQQLDAETITRVRMLTYAIVNNLVSAGVVTPSNRSRAFDSTLTSLGDSNVSIREPL